MIRTTTFLIVFSFLFVSCGNGGGSNSSMPSPSFSPSPSSSPEICIERTNLTDNGFGLNEREFSECLNIDEESVQTNPFKAVNAFENLTFDTPVDIQRVPGTSYFVVVEQNTSQIKIFENDSEVSETSVFIDLADRVFTTGFEFGLVKITFDPDFETNGFFYVTYSTNNELSPDVCLEFCSVVSRFSSSGELGLVGDPDTEEVILSLPQESNIHNVGHLVFGPDGFLYIGVGDEGGANDPKNNAQNRTNLYGSILRVDVSGDLPYDIPQDNPFVGLGLEDEGVVGAGNPIRSEIWAYGLRNPHRFSFDPVHGFILAGDVGQDSTEEINRIEPGGNYGWRVFEGSQEHILEGTGRDQSYMILPLVEYDRSLGSCVIGGDFYQGSLFPSLIDSFIYGDCTRGNLWSLRIDENGEVVENVNIGNIGGGVSVVSFLMDEEEIYIVNISQGIIQKLVVNENPESRVPEKLSETGVFIDLETLTTPNDLIPYDVSAPLWSDAAVKSRWFTIPEDKFVRFEARSSWDFPVGSVFVKHFAMDLDEIDQENALTNLETRLFIHTIEGWVGYSYKWNEDQSEAFLVEEAESIELDIMTDEGMITQEYYYPSTADCWFCHNVTAGYVLGLKTAQINRDFQFPIAIDNQIRVYDHIELFTDMIDHPSNYEHVFSSLDDSYSTIEHKARSYLASNCSHCHNGINPLPTDIDLSYPSIDYPLNAIDKEPLSDLGVDDAKIIFPGDRNRSVLWLRINATDDNRMPPLATSRIDEAAVDLIGEWIDRMPINQELD